jgi:hypothetical protein
MEPTPLTLSHREILFKPLRSIGTAVSEYSFANLYLFRREHDYKVITADELLITGKTRAGVPYVMPTRDVRAIPREALDLAIRQHGMMFPVIEEWLPVFDFPAYAVTSDDADSDYLHDIAKLTTYAGNKLHGKKNLMNQFVKTYTSSELPLTSDRLPHAREILDAWQAESGSPAGVTDYEACGEAIALYDDLCLCGGIYYADGVPAGFVIGEELNETTFALHFAKAKRAFVGINQYMFSRFAAIMPPKYSAFNFEQDLGIESLRRSKVSYRPEKMLRKYRVLLR